MTTRRVETIVQKINRVERELKDVRTRALRRAAPQWQEYTPTLGASTSNPSLGSTTLLGRYIVQGDRVDAQVLVSLGTSFSAGTGTYSVSLPTPATDIDNWQVIGSGMLYDSSTSTTWTFAVTPTSGLTSVEFHVDGSNLLTDSSPVALVDGDRISFDVTY